jgi:hypothetical protein
MEIWGSERFQFFSSKDLAVWMFISLFLITQGFTTFS